MTSINTNSEDSYMKGAPANQAPVNQAPADSPVSPADASINQAPTDAEFADTILMSKRVKVVKTGCMLFVYLGIGLWNGVVTPTIVDLTSLYNTTYEELVHTASFKAIGMFCGSLTGGLAADRFRSRADIVIFLAAFLGGGTVVAIPWVPDLMIMKALFYFYGLAQGTLNIVCSSITIAMWGKSAPAPVYALHMMFTLGATIMPPITIPFLTTASHQVNATNHSAYHLYTIHHQLNFTESSGFDRFSTLSPQHIRGVEVNLSFDRVYRDGYNVNIMKQSGLNQLSNENQEFSSIMSSFGNHKSANIHQSSDKDDLSYDQLSTSGHQVFTTRRPPHPNQPPMIWLPYDVYNTIPATRLTAPNHTDTSPNVTYTKVRIPYAICGAWSASASFIFLIFFLCGSTYTSSTIKKRESVREMLNLTSVARGSLPFGIYFTVSLFLLYNSLQSNSVLASLIFLIANTGSLHLSKPVSATLVTVYNLVCVSGRGISAILSRWLPVQVLLFTQVIISCVMQSMLVLFAMESVTSFWILTCIASLFMSPLYPSVMAWSDRYIEATGVVIAIMDIGIGTGSFISLWLSGTLFQRHGAKAVFILMAILGGSVLLILTPLQVVSHLKGDRHKVDTTKQSTSINADEEQIDPDTDPLLS